MVFKSSVHIPGGGGGGTVDTVTGTAPITVDNTDPANPIVATTAILTSLAALSPLGTGFFAYTTGTDTFSGAALTAAGRALLDDTTNVAQRTTLGLTTQAANVACSSNITYTFDRADGVWHKATFTSDCTLAFTFPANCVESFVFETVDGGAYSIMYPAGILWAGGIQPTLSTSGTDRLVIFTDGNNNLSGAVIQLDVS